MYFLCILGKSRSNSQTEENSIDDTNVTKRAKKVSSICVNLPAAGLGARPPSIHSSTTADEGGFNEPSPEIKAKLKPVYDFDQDNVPPLPCTPDQPPQKLTYVDLLEHRVPADGNECEQLYDETDAYRKQQISNHFISKTNDKIVYAVISKPDAPTKDFPLEPENILDIDADANNTNNQETLNDQDLEKGYHSPQTILDPTRTRLDEDPFLDIINKKLPPEPPLEIPERDFSDDEEVFFKNKKIPPPPIPEIGSPLDLQDVEFADASDNEEEKQPNSLNSENCPDAMTADEADRLLSSR